MGAVRAVLAGEQALGNDLVEELGRTLRGDRIERSAQDVVVEMRGCHAVAEEPVNGNVREELRIQVEPPFHEPEPVSTMALTTSPWVRWCCRVLGMVRSMTAAIPRVSKAPATIPRWPIEMLDPSMKSAD